MKTDKKIYKRYLKNDKLYKKDLINFIKKEEVIYDWDTIPMVLLKMIEGRLNYYLCGDNVLKSDESVTEIIKTLKEAKRLGEYAVNIDDYLDYKVMDIDKFVEFNKKESEAYRKFFEYVGANILSWWD